MSGSITTWTSIDQVVAPASADRRSNDARSRADDQARFDEHLDRALGSSGDRSRRATDDAPPAGRPPADDPDRLDIRARFERRLGGRRPAATESSHSRSTPAQADVTAPSDTAPNGVGAGSEVPYDPERVDDPAPVVVPAIIPPPAALVTVDVVASVPTPTIPPHLTEAEGRAVRPTPTVVDGVLAAADRLITRPVDPSNVASNPAATPMVSSMPGVEVAELSSSADAPVGTVLSAAPTASSPHPGALDDAPSVATLDRDAAGTTARPSVGSTGSVGTDVTSPTSVAATVQHPTGSDAGPVADAEAVAATSTVLAAAAERARPARHGASRGSEPSPAHPAGELATGASPGVAADLVDGSAVTPRPVTTAPGTTMPDTTAATGPLVAERRAPTVDTTVAESPMATDTTPTERAGSGVPVSVPHLSIDLSDEGLGPLTLQAQQGAGGVHVRLTAADARVSDLLSHAGAELRHDLESSGVVLESLDIGHGDLARRHAGGERQRSTTGPRPSPAPPPALIPRVDTARPGAPRRTSAIDGVDVRI